MADKSLKIPSGYPGQIGLLAEQMNQGFGGGLLAQKNYLNSIYSPMSASPDKPVLNPTKQPADPVKPVVSNPRTYDDLLKLRDTMPQDDWAKWVGDNRQLFQMLWNPIYGRGKGS